jgi:hypothetical protein
MSDHCGSVTEDGAAVCVPGTCSCSSDAKSNEPISLSLPSLSENKKTVSQSIIQINNNQEQTMWKKIRSGLMFGVACITSPCCTPIIVPIALALLAGTPVAVWLSANVGWVYGGLTLLSVVSLVLGFRWMGQKNAFKGSKPKATIQPIQEITRP